VSGVQTGVSRVGWAMPGWLGVTVYFAAALVLFFGGDAVGIGVVSVLVAIAGGYLAVWLVNRLYLRCYPSPDPGADDMSPGG
jgi:hypothetical protein